MTKREINSSLEKSDFDFANQILYDLCSSHPLHKRADVIIAKIWLIGRAYSAAIERTKNKNKITYADVAQTILNKKIDLWFNPLRRVEVIKGNEKRIIKAHKELTDIFSEITDLEKRSLSSKYLHFHCQNLFFIYDSRAKNGLRKLNESLDITEEFSLDLIENYDKEYFSFFKQCLNLQTHIKSKYDKDLTPRDIDKLLLWACK